MQEQQHQQIVEQFYRIELDLAIKNTTWIFLKENIDTICHKCNYINLLKEEESQQWNTSHQTCHNKFQQGNNPWNQKLPLHHIYWNIIKWDCTYKAYLQATLTKTTSLNVVLQTTNQMVTNKHIVQRPFTSQIKRTNKANSWRTVCQEPKQGQSLVQPVHWVHSQEVSVKDNGPVEYIRKFTTGSR